MQQNAFSPNHSEAAIVSAADSAGNIGENEPREALLPRLWRVFREETMMLRPRLLLVQLITALLPPYVGNRVRVVLLRLIGFSVGGGTVMWDLPRFSGSGNFQRLLFIGDECRLNIGCHIDLNASVTIGDRVGFGHQVMLLTTTHEIGGPRRRSSHPLPRPITIGEGCWLGARCMVMPGVTIGAGSVVAAGAVVTKDVPPNTLVAGVPARAIRHFDDAS